MTPWRKPWLAQMAEAAQRCLGPGRLTACGVGVMVGAGILAPLDPVVGHATAPSADLMGECA
ncbi:MAG: hypothetical protein C0426_06780 [Rhodobacter sp.]|nr:hypothetical protein [Rhodobacter sp.]